MPAIICYGDSNTYGYEPPGGRYPEEVRWTGVLEANGFTVINEGMCGRMIPVDPVLMDYFAAKMSGYDEPDIFMIMLGGNNILNEEGITAEKTAEKMDAFLDCLPKISWYDPKKTLLLSPVMLKPGSWVWDDSMIEMSAQLGELYAAVAEKHGINYLDTTGWEIEKLSDGVHYTPAGHKAFGGNLYEYIKNKLDVL